MSLIATWFSEGRRAQHPPVPRYPLRICRWRVLGRQYGAAWRCKAYSPISGPAGSTSCVIYKVDRLTRSLARFCAAGRDLRRTDAASFVPVTQQLNTTTELDGAPHPQCVALYRFY